MIPHKPPYTLNELKIEIISACPLACLHCSSDSTPSSKISIDKSDLLGIINEAISMHVNEIAFSGGEPLLHPNVIDAVHLASKSQIKTLVYTSGCIDEFPDIINRLIKAGLNKIIFSLYSENSEQHESITRIRGSHQKTIQAIEYCIKKSLSTEVHFVALKRTYKSLRGVAEHVKSLGVKRLSVLRFVPQGRGYLLANDILTNTQYIELKSDIETLRGSGIEIRTGSPFNFLLLSKSPKCNSAIDRLIIAPDLYIYPCDAFKRISAKDIVGNDSFSKLGREKGLSVCWEKSRYIKAIREYLTSPFAKPCDECEWLESCISGCLAQKVLYSGNFEKRPDPNCMRAMFLKG